MAGDIVTTTGNLGWGNGGYYCSSCGMWVYDTHVCNFTYTPVTTTVATYMWPPKELAMTDADIDKVADRVIEKFKAELLSMLLDADPAAVTQLLLKAVSKN